MHLYIKNMVCNRCITAVRTELGKLGLHPLSISLGEVVTEEKKLSKEQYTKLAHSLQEIGFELIDDKKLIRKIYHALVETQEYRTYIATGASDNGEEKKILEFILNDLILANEVVVSHIEENFSNWDDDGEMIVQLLAGYLQKPGS